MNPFYNRSTTLKPVLLFHGFLCTGTAWLIASNGRLNVKTGRYQELENSDGTISREPIGNSLGFVLASRQFDVWLANYRGSLYSSQHVTLSSDGNLHL